MIRRVTAPFLSIENRKSKIENPVDFGGRANYRAGAFHKVSPSSPSPGRASHGNGVSRKMSRASSIPLHVYEVLEEEYESLHGPITKEPLVVHLPGKFRAESAGDRAPDHAPGAGAPAEEHGLWREVEAARDWDFRRGHLRDATGLAAALLPSDAPERRDLPAELAQQIQAFDWAKEQLKKRLYAGLGAELLRELLAAGRGDEDEHGHLEVPRELEARLERALNERVLADPALYDEERFADSWLSPASRGLAKLWREGVKFEGADLRHFNRTLLEDAFPNEIEPVHNIRLAAVCQRLHAARPAALSLSGGGIRSGTFALGLLQGLARHDLLKGFDYLSTVSGGGYIGGWLTAWIHRHPDGLEGVTRELANHPPLGRIDPEPAPLLHLRKYSNFITPQVGLLTADTWTFVGIYLRNLLLNWMVFIPLLLAVLLVPRLLVAITMGQPTNPEPLFDPGEPGGFQFHGRYFFLVLGSILGVWALAYIDFNRPGLGERLRRVSPRWRRRTDQRSFLRFCLVPLVGAAALLTLYFAWSTEQSDPKNLDDFAIFGVIFVLAGWLISSLVLRRFGGGWDEPGVDGQPTLRRLLIEPLVLAIIGAIGGVLAWALSLAKDLGDPVVGYGPMRETGRAFEYTKWTWWGDWTTEIYVCLAVPVFLLVFWGATTLFVGVSSRWKFVSDEDREWWSRFGAWVLIAVLVWVAGNALVLFGPLALLSFPRVLAAVGGLSGLAALLLGRSAKTQGTNEQQSEADKSKGSTLMARLLPLLALVFLAAFLATLSLATTGLIQLLTVPLRPLAAPVTSAGHPPGSMRERLADLLTNVEQPWPSPLPSPKPSPRPPHEDFAEHLRYVVPTPEPAPTPVPSPLPEGVDAPAHDPYVDSKLAHMNVLHHTSLWFLAPLAAFLFLFGYLLSRVINLNVFSLHGGYRNRLIRAFLGASRPAGERRANPFTGFDAADNVPMHELRPGLLDEDDFVAPGRLADELRDQSNPLSRRLAEKKLLENVSAVAAGGDVLTALRTDLNRVLIEESLYEDFEPGPPRTPRAPARARTVLRRVAAARGGVAPRRSELRTDYHILLNRLVLEQAYGDLIKPAPYPPPPYKLLHVVNCALNLVGGDNLAWQQRKAEPFSVSPLHSGCFRLGYRESRNYGGSDTGGISIGTAASISGAAASSNMGYYTTSPVISLLLTLFNVRLGWWLGNPGPFGHKTYQDRAPRNSVLPVVSEAFGMTDDKNKYVYLSDGGHFENLALYEMVLRRCRVIVCADGAQDAEYRFGDLGNAVRKIRIDLGIPIEFTAVPIYPQRPPREEGQGLYWAVGRIRYSCVDWGAEDGVLLYVKPAVYGAEPRDVLEYKKSFPDFPHQTTADQFFDEPQFESYRALGSHVMDALCGEELGTLDLHDLLRRAYDSLAETRAGQPAPDPKLRDWMRDWLDRQRPTSPP
jgi:Patatin-like phospholipase